MDRRLSRRSVDLSGFAGKSARIRFRLVADQLFSAPAYQGWTIDNIRVQAGAAFNTLANVSSSTMSLALGGKADGAYAYRAVALFGNCASNPFATTPSNVVQTSVTVATRPPMAAFTVDSNPSDAGQSVSFDASASSDQDSVGATPGHRPVHLVLRRRCELFVDDAVRIARVHHCRNVSRVSDRDRR